MIAVPVQSMAFNYYLISRCVSLRPSYMHMTLVDFWNCFKLILKRSRLNLSLRLSDVPLANTALVLCWYGRVSNWLAGAGMIPGRLFRAEISRALVWITPDLL